MSEQKAYKGGCHCGKVRFEVEADLSKVFECNCSICSTKAPLLQFVPTESFKLLSGEDALTEYKFNKMVISHLFCATCGIESFARGTGPDGKKMVAINARALEGVSPGDLNVVAIDGRSL